MPLATIVVYGADRKLRPAAMTFSYSAIAAILLLGATIFMLRSVAEGQASVLVPITQMGFIVAALLGIFVLRERITATQGGRAGLGVGSARGVGRKLSAVRSRRAQPTIAARQLRSRLPAACKSVDRRASARYFTSLLA